VTIRNLFSFFFFVFNPHHRNPAQLRRVSVVNYTPLVGRALINTTKKVIYGAVGCAVAGGGAWRVAAGLLTCCSVRDIRFQDALCGAGRPMFVSEANTE
jgi:hypothetical protein